MLSEWQLRSVIHKCGSFSVALNVNFYEEIHVRSARDLLVPIRVSTQLQPIHSIFVKFFKKMGRLP